MRKFLLVVLAIGILFYSETQCGIIPVAEPIIEDSIFEDFQPQEITRDFLVQTFAVFIDQNLLFSYKKGLDRKHYVYEIAEAAADIELSDRSMGCWILAIAKKESNFRIRGNRKSTAKGLCQVIPKYHMKTLSNNNIQVKDLLESPQKSLYAGYLVLRGYFNRTPTDYKRAIFRYRGFGSKGLSQKRCEEYWYDVESTYATLYMRIYD